MPEADGVIADHHKYVVPNIVDAEVVERQSRDQLDKKGDTSYVHYHRHNEDCQGHQHTWHGPKAVV